MTEIIKQGNGVSSLNAFLDQDGDLILDQDGDGVVITKKGASELIKVLQEWVTAKAQEPANESE